MLLHQLPEGSEYRKHYHLINNVDAAMYVRYETQNHGYKYCQPCGKRILAQNFDKHQCKGLRCTDCTKLFGTKADLAVHISIADPHSCPDCNRLLRHGPKCLEEHLTPHCKGRGTWFCYETFDGQTTLNRIPVSHKGEHVCGEAQCPNCNLWIQPYEKKGKTLRHKEILFDHSCLVREKKKPTEKEAARNAMRSIYMCDTESLLVPGEVPGVCVHEPFYIHVQQMEYLCFPEGDPHHKDVSFGFSGPECMLQLFRWAKSLREPSTILFHNGAAYDTLMFLREMRSILTEDDEMPVPITAGTRIMSLKFGCSVHKTL